LWPIRNKNGRKKEGLRERSEEVKFSEQEEVILSNPCSLGIEKKNLPFAAHACFIQGTIGSICAVTTHAMWNTTTSFIIVLLGCPVA
jgi:hypothetical protein